MSGSTLQIFLAELGEFQEFGNARRAPGDPAGHWRPTNINGRTSGVWEFEATGASPAAARAWARCTRPPALRHRMGVYGV